MLDTFVLATMGGHRHFAIEFWGKIIKMAKKLAMMAKKQMAKNGWQKWRKTSRHFCHNGENCEKIDGENGENRLRNFFRHFRYGENREKNVINGEWRCPPKQCFPQIICFDLKII